MGIAVMVMGHSGSGKSYSLRNFDPSEVGIFNVSRKPLPFRKKFEFSRLQNSRSVKSSIARGTRKAYVIDDAQYLMAFEEMDTNLTGFDKWNEIGYGFVSLVRSVSDLPEDTIVYFLMHTEVGADGRIKAKTLGNLIDNHYTLEGMFTAVIKCDCDSSGHYFEVLEDGSSTVKTPPGLYTEKRIPNDLKAFDTAIREYYGIGTSGGEDGE